MDMSIEAVVYPGYDNLKVDYETVGECPLCHTGLDPEEVAAYLFPTSEEYRLFVIHYCFKCEQCYIGKYSETEGHLCFGNPIFFPARSKNLKFDLSLEKLSPDFVKIFSQAVCAEENNLDQIAGIGFRKSIEFLIKDYLCKKLSEPEKNVVKKENLSQSINRISDKRIQILASRAAWIGNDETHYIRKHQDRDITDMKRFINAMVHFIQSELAFQEALEMRPVK